MSKIQTEMEESSSKTNIEPLGYIKNRYVMNKKILAAILIVAIFLVCLCLCFGVFSNAKKPLQVSNIAIKDCTDYFVIRIMVSLPSGIQTLYNCRIEVEYLTQNESWKTSSKNIGLVNYGDNIQETFELDDDFKSGNPYLKPDGYFHGDAEPNVKVEAYGYLQP